MGFRENHEEEKLHAAIKVKWMKKEALEKAQKYIREKSITERSCKKDLIFSINWLTERNHFPDDLLLTVHGVMTWLEEELDKDSKDPINTAEGLAEDGQDVVKALQENLRARGNAEECWRCLRDLRDALAEWLKRLKKQVINPLGSLSEQAKWLEPRLAEHSKEVEGFARVYGCAVVD